MEATIKNEELHENKWKRIDKILTIIAEEAKTSFFSGK
jgi:hypothetical protein